MRVDLAKKAFKDLYVNKGLHWVDDHFDWFVKTYSNLLASEMGKQNSKAWREENRKKQAAGVKFECCGSNAWEPKFCSFIGRKEWYREVPQESPKVKESAVMIPEASREILKVWQKQGLNFNVGGMVWDTSMCGWMYFTDIGGRKNYTIPEQPIPEGMSVEMVEAMWWQGLRVEYNNHGTWEIETNSNFPLPRISYRIPAQPIPEKLLEVPQEVSGAEYARAEPHAAERALWKAQREAGTNEVWQWENMHGIWMDVCAGHEPEWNEDCKYRVKPMKLTAKIISGGVYKTSYYWEFTGTREEYRAECEKYGYVVVSNIEEVKPKTVKYYFALYKSKQGDVRAVTSQNKTWIEALPDMRGYTIIGDIEEREVEV